MGETCRRRRRVRRHTGGTDLELRDQLPKAVEIAGADVWRIDSGRLAEGWTLCDVATLFMQIGAFPAPARAEAGR